MIGYYISASNINTIRIDQACTNAAGLIWETENLYTFQKVTSSLGNYSYDKYQSLLTFTASLTSPLVGDEYRARIYDSSSVYWHGSVQVFTSQSVDKSEPNNQIPLEDIYISHETENQYIILE
jgi:hypothetical protein